MYDKQTLFSVLQVNMQSKDFFLKMAKKKITAIGYEYMKDDSSLYAGNTNHEVKLWVLHNDCIRIIE